MPWFQAPDGSIYCAEIPLIRTSNIREVQGENGECIVEHDSAIDPQILDRPSDRHQWNGSAWAIQYCPKWDELQNKLRLSDLFAKAFATRNQNAWSLLLHCMISNAPDELRLQDFKFAIAAIRQGLSEDFTAEQLQRFRELLDACDFPSGLV